VSFYKDLAGQAGAALAGPQDLIENARVWQVRHGGLLYTAHPFLIAAERGLDDVLPRIPEFVAHARELAAALAELDGVDVAPDPPHTNMFHVYVQRPLEPLREAALDQAERTRTFLGFVRPTELPGVQKVELTIGLASLEVPVEEAQELWAELLAATSAAIEA
jgi:threonine aldolase